MNSDDTRPEVVIKGETYVLLDEVGVHDHWMYYDNGNGEYGFVHPAFGELTLEHLRDLQSKVDALASKT